MKFGVIVFPGSNCDMDMVHVLRDVMGFETEILWHKDKLLNDYSTDDWVVLPGGFSYGDYLRSGAIARFSPIMEAVIEFANQGGNVLGVCNGFQILCESHLLPGALLHNANQQFICENVYLKAESYDTAVTNAVPQDAVLKVPIAHAEGRYYADAETLTKLNNNKQILFRYCNADGTVNDAANLNGSLENIAGICNETRNVFGMMPHPERAAEDALGNTDGRWIFESIKKVIGEPA